MNMPSTALWSCLLVLILLVTATADAEHGSGETLPATRWVCPPNYPVKGNFTTWNGEPCIYHVPGGQLYHKTKPERCYETEEEAQARGCRKSLR
jgi:hypothetical protein